MVKKIMILGITVLLLFLTACNIYPVDSFDSLEEMQAVLPKDMYYLDFNQEGIKESGKFEATKTNKDGGYFRYSIWYDVEYTISGQKQERKLRVVVTDITRPISDKRIYVVDIEEYFYYLILEGGQQKLNEDEIKYFISIFELALESKHQIS